ncbi:MAG: PAS domain S-box protein [Acidobacteria bacterium]|nr:PAS domain S-box protein [Acidobacteriota bacterium]
MEKNAVESNNRLVLRIVDKHGRGEVSIKQATRSVITRYGVAVISVALAFALALSAKTLMDRAIFLLFMSAVVVSSRYGGMRPGLLAALLSIFSCIFILLPSLLKSASVGGDVFALVVFALVAVFVSSSNVARSRAEAALKQAETNYQRIFENAITGIYQTTVEGRYVTANPMLARMFGYDSPEELIAASEKEDILRRRFYVEAGRRDEFIKLVNENDAVTGFESEIYCRDNRRMWIAEHALTIRDAEGKLIGFQGTTIDITDHKRAEEALRKAHDELERRVAERTADLAKTNEALRVINEELHAEVAERRRVEESLRALSAHLQSVREAERTRIAREIHDDLGQMLTAVMMDLSWLEDKLSKPRDVAARNALAEKVAALSKLVGKTMDTVRTLAAELRPGILDELGLKAAIEWQCADFQKRASIKCHLITDLEAVALDRASATAMFRILQESLTNVFRHAKATLVTLTLDERGNELVLTVRDDGRGITEADIADPRSLGILGMRERATMYEGTFDIANAEGDGTRVTVRMPLLKLSEAARVK